MDKLKMQTTNKADENFKKLAAMFPNAITETIDDVTGEVVRAIDKDVLMQEISCKIVDENDERYQFSWPDKKKSVLLANSPISKTLRPCKEESVGKDGNVGGFDSENLYIEGDNLEVLKLLQETYLGKIKMIYIDPPYNTGNDFVYEDAFAQSANEYVSNSGQFDEYGNRLVINAESNGRFHTDWLNMIYPRLKVAKDLLKKDGIIFISIDDNELENMIKVGNEIFGENNFIGQWNWVKSKTPPNLSKKIKKNIEYIVAYQKGENYDFFKGIQKISRSDDPITKPQNSFKVLHFNPGELNFKIENETFIKGIYGTDKYPNELLNDLIVENYTNKNEVNFSNRFIWTQTKLDEEISNGTKINVSNSLVISYKKSNYNPEVPPNIIDEKVGVDTTENAGRNLIELLGGKYFDYPKPISLLKYILNFNLSKEDIVLDFFSGSATTAHAVMQINAEDHGNRKFIMVQIPEKTDIKSEAYKAGYENICEIGKERIRRAGKKIKEEAGLLAENIDIGFRVLKCDTSNMKDVYYNPSDYEMNLFDDLTDNIKEDRTPEDLLFQVMLDLGVLLSSKIEEMDIAGKKIFNVADGFLIACFEENITDETIIEIAKQQPYYFVMRDSSLANDSVATNYDQIFATYSPDTVRKVL